MDKLRYYQEEAVESIDAFFNSNTNKAKIYISAGLGRTDIILSAVKKIFGANCDVTIAILAEAKMKCESITSRLQEENGDSNVASRICDYKGEKILITTYEDVCNNQTGLENFELIICDDAQFLKPNNYFDSLIKKDIKFLGVLQSVETTECWFYDAETKYSYLIKDAIKDSFDMNIGETELIQNFLIPLLEYQEYTKISTEVKIFNAPNRNVRADIVAEKDNKTIVIEVKSYRGLYNSKAILNNAIKQVLQYQHILEKDGENKYSFIIVLPCEVDKETQQNFYSKFHIIIWDINNLIYLCEGNRELLDSLMRCISYPALDLKPKKPLEIVAKQRDVRSDDSPTTSVELYINELEQCISGRKEKADKKYELICTKTIKYLFETEFYRISEQHRTDDEMFRMDLLCSLKGTTEFWNFLISFYKTKFVVFEFKNYDDYVKQNLVYITEKYLFPVALRNVAFIISRKGFDPNAEKAALGCLRENGKLIISLTDDDLVKMLYMKENGEEPSDYLLNKVEQLLMSVSK